MPQAGFGTHVLPHCPKFLFLINSFAISAPEPFLNSINHLFTASHPSWKLPRHRDVVDQRVAMYVSAQPSRSHG